MQRKTQNLIFDPFPIRTLAKHVVKTLNLGSYEQRVNIGAVERLHYGFCVYQAAKLEKVLGYNRISVVEYGVAGGKGSVNPGRDE